MKAAREELGRREGREVTQADMARRLTVLAGYDVHSDQIRKAEGADQFLAHDLLFFFAEVVGISTGVLLAPVARHPFTKRLPESPQPPRPRATPPPR